MTQAFPAGLSSVQSQVAFSLASGASITNAATSAGVGRSTIHHWIGTQPAFAQLVEEARTTYVLTLRDQLRDASAKALTTLTSILDDPNAPASVRLKAALAILNRPQFPDRGWCLPERIEDPAKVQFLDSMDELKANSQALTHAQNVMNYIVETELDKSGHISNIPKPLPHYQQPPIPTRMRHNRTLSNNNPALPALSTPPARINSDATPRALATPAENSSIAVSTAQNKPMPPLFDNHQTSPRQRTQQDCARQASLSEMLW